MTEDMKLEEKEITLLREVHQQARRFFRYNGIDKERTVQALIDLDAAVYKVNLFDQNLFEEDD